MRKDFRLPAVLTAFLIISGCSSSSHTANESYILVASNTHIPYWQAALAGLQQAGKEMNVRTYMVGPARYDPQAEHQEFANAIGEKPAGILVSAADPNILAPDIDSAMQQGIPVITIDADAPASKRLYFIGSDNYAAGKLGGQLLAKLLNGRGNVVMFTYPRQTNLTERQQGYQSVFDNYPDIKVNQAVDIAGDAAVAYSTTKELVASKAPVNAFVCLEAVACPQVGEVINESNLSGKVTIVAMDTDDRTLDWIQKGVISATIAQKPFTMAYLGMKMLDDIHHHPPKSLTVDFRQDAFSPYPAFVGTGTFIVDENNLSAVQQQNQQKPQPNQAQNQKQ